MLHLNSDSFKQKVISNFQNFNILKYKNELKTKKFLSYMKKTEIKNG